MHDGKDAASAPPKSTANAVNTRETAKADVPDAARQSAPVSANSPAQTKRAVRPRDAGAAWHQPSTPAADSQEDAGVEPPILDTPAPLSISESTPLAAVVGAYGPERSAQQFYAGDLGWAVESGERLWVLFGDSWANPLTTSFDVDARQPADDAIGFIDLEQFPDGTSVDRWIAEHPAAGDEFSWQAEPPPLTVSVSEERRVATPSRETRDGDYLSSGPGLTPLTGFSDGRDLFALFFRNGPVECASGACPDGLVCDTGLGVCVANNKERTDLSMPCVLGSPAAQGCDRCEPVPGAGLCVDTRNSLYDANVPRGRTASVAATHEVGNLLRGSDHIFATQPWITKRFYNPTARSVRDFDAARAQGVGNDYRPTDGSHPERHGIFLWGRPGFGGIHNAGRDAQLYLAWVPMPGYAEDGHINWKPQYYAGQDETGHPRFVEREVDSVPLDLDAAQSGEQPEEIVDVTNQMSVSYLPSLQRWIMLYGGDLYGNFAELLYAEDVALIDDSTRGPLYVRYAKHPWGPWTAPEIFAEDGDRNEPSGFYASGGIMRGARCAGQCVRSELNLLGDQGWLYAPSIIDPWTQEHEGAVDLYWHISTWNPYAVILMKTTLRP